MVKRKPSFNQAIEAAFLWCSAWDKGELSDEVLADRVSELIETFEGARGFFAISLSSDSPLMDRLPEALVIELRKAGDSIVDLSVKNMAMSSAMAIHHHMKNDSLQEEKSKRITSRCIDLLKMLEPKLVKDRIEKLLAATNGEGDDLPFLKKWNYNKKQISAIVNSINKVAS